MSSSFIAPSPTLRNALLADAVVSGSAGLLQVGGGAAAVSMLGLPQPLVLGPGLFMLAYVALLFSLLRTSAWRRWWVATIVIGNFAWADACLLLWAFDVVSPAPLGTAWLLVQAAGVTALAAWQGVGWRRSRPLPRNSAPRESAAFSVAR
jgi:hypothetical protein